MFSFITVLIQRHREPYISPERLHACFHDVISEIIPEFAGMNARLVTSSGILVLKIQTPV